MNRDGAGVRWTRRAVAGRLGVGLALGVALGVTLGLGACVSTPPPPPTNVVLSVTASNDVNADASGVGNPVQLHVYWLAVPTTFQQADFFALTESPSATLGQELVSHEQVIVRPGQGVGLNRTATKGEAYVGLVAAYRDLDAVSWRSVVTLQPHTQNVIDATLARGGLSVALRPPVAAR